MAKTVRIPASLRQLTQDREVVIVEADTVGQAIDQLEKNHPGIKARLVDPTGALHRFVNLYVNEEDIRFLKDQETELRDGDEISIIPAIAGG